VDGFLTLRKLMVKQKYIGRRMDVDANLRQVAPKLG